VGFGKSSGNRKTKVEGNLSKERKSNWKKVKRYSRNKGKEQVSTTWTFSYRIASLFQNFQRIVSMFQYFQLVVAVIDYLYPMCTMKSPTSYGLSVTSESVRDRRAAVG
jgi:hypothetical protein